MELKIIYLNPAELKPYEKNTRKHADKDIKNIIDSIKKYGFNDPIGIYGDDNLIVEGHGRQIAALKMKMPKVPCVRLDHMTDEQRREYAIAHNATAELSEWDFDMLADELADLDMGEFDFGFLDKDDKGEIERKKQEFKERMDAGEDLTEDEEYLEFVEKFTPKKTTDDCYTPDNIYGAVADWVAEEYRVNKKNFVRPFYPGGDYQAYKYKKTDIVVDNPPFSILAEIVKWYTEKQIKYFLFAPTLTLFSSSSSSSSSCALCIGVTVTYENSAGVDTSFLTNLETEMRLRSAPTLYNAVNEANKVNLAEMRKKLPKYEYPDYIITSTRCGQFSRRGIEFKVPKDESVHIRVMDAQKEQGKSIFGSGYLLSERLARIKEKAEREKAEREKAEREKAEREKAEREKAERWQLSDREFEIVRSLKKK